ncbi:MAG: hypothetical protein KJO07_20360 [Deltaproteobacteria bacterium]|nr:hypothetical protein [Deltaproteobacteria bacterium]
MKTRPRFDEISDPTPFPVDDDDEGFVLVDLGGDSNLDVMSFGGLRFPNGAVVTPKLSGTAGPPFIDFDPVPVWSAGGPPIGEIIAATSRPGATSFLGDGGQVVVFEGLTTSGDSVDSTGRLATSVSVEGEQLVGLAATADRWLIVDSTGHISCLYAPSATDLVVTPACSSLP